MKLGTLDSPFEGMVMGFDFGTKRIGVAVGETSTRTAQALTTITYLNNQPRWEAIERCINEWRPKALIVGIPVKMDGSPQWITEKAQSFAKTLHQKTQLPVIGVDERLTSVEARDRIFTQSGYKGLQKQSIDAMAAKILLEDWLLSHT